jgi:hypothetical protein
MPHNHGKEYQIRIVYEDGTERAGGWMNREEELSQAMAALPGTPGKTFWLRERNVPCPDCLDIEQQMILEYRIANIASPRCRPHDSSYLLAVGSKSRYEVHEAFNIGRRY